MSVTFDASEVSGQLIRVGKRAKNFDHSLLTALLQEFVEDTFDSEGRKGVQGKWRPLALSTIARHPNRSSGQLLLNDGLLSKWQTATQGETSIVWSPASYAKFSATGTKFMPRRDPFAINISRFMQEAERMISLEVGR